MRRVQSIGILVATLAGFAPAGLRVGDAAPAVQKPPQRPEAEDVDFCQVKVFSKTSPESGTPTIFMTYTPTEEIRVDQPVLFRFWFQGRDPGPLKVDFGDQTRLDDYASYSEVTHRFQTPGIHILTAQCEAEGKPIMLKQKVVVAARSDN